MKKIIAVFLLLASFLTQPLLADKIIDSLKNPKTFTPYNANSKQWLKELSMFFEQMHPFTQNSTPIDIFIPTVEKDLPTLGYCVSYARRNLLHPIQNVYIVAPASEKLMAFCKDNNCIFVDETTVLPILMRDIPYFPGGADRRSWLFQQFLKLSCDTVCKSEHILVIDSDTVIVRPQSLRFNNRNIFEYADEHTGSYLEAYEKLFFTPAKAPFSFVCHHMLFEKTKLRRMKEVMEQNHQKRWFDAIIDVIDKNSFAAFCEYETYGNFFIDNYPNEFFQLYFFNAAFPRSDIPAFVNGKIFKMSPHGKYTKTVSFHSWMN